LAQGIDKTKQIKTVSVENNRIIIIIIIIFSLLHGHFVKKIQTWQQLNATLPLFCSPTLNQNDVIIV